MSCDYRTWLSDVAEIFQERTGMKLDEAVPRFELQELLEDYLRHRPPDRVAFGLTYYASVKPGTFRPRVIDGGGR